MYNIVQRYLAIAEKGDKPGIFIYDTTKLGATRKGIKKSISLSDMPIKDITAINFVPGQEDKYLVFIVSIVYIFLGINIFYCRLDNQMYIYTTTNGIRRNLSLPSKLFQTMK